MIEWLQRLIQRRQPAYKQLFNSPVGAIVLADLAEFCRAHKTTFHQNSRISDVLEGRREVWLRIQDHLKMSPDELYKVLEQEIKTRQAYISRSQQ